MILAYKHVPADTHDAKPQWVFVGELPDEDAIRNLSQGEYAIHTATKATVGEGPEAANEIPKGFSFSHRLTWDGKQLRKK